MKNNGDFRDSVFRKAKDYEKAKRLARKKKIKAVAAVLLCLFVLTPAVYIPISVAMGNLSTADTTVATIAENSASAKETNAALQATTVQVDATTAKSTTVGTANTTTPAFTWASTTTACGPGEMLQESSFFNGANHVMTEYDAKYGEGFRAEIEYYLTDDTAPYFSESFFAENAVIIVRFNASVGSKPCFLRMHKEISGELRIDIGFPVTESDGGEATWLIMIPISLDTLNGVTEIEVYENDLFVSE